MSTYTPDKWLMVKITSPKHGVIYKLMASFYGGYTGSNSWKLSSGTTSAKSDETHFYEFPQCSGSTYMCHKNTYGASMYTSGVLQEYIDRVAALNDGSSIEVLPEGTDFSAIDYGTMT